MALTLTLAPHARRAAGFGKHALPVNTHDVSWVLCGQQVCGAVYRAQHGLCYFMLVTCPCFTCLTEVNVPLPLHMQCSTVVGPSLGDWSGVQPKYQSVTWIASGHACKV